MTKFKWLLGILMMLLLAGLFAVSAGSSSVQAQAPTPSDNQVNEVARQMYCPVCENIPLDVCPTTACAEWRELIRLKISEGLTTEEIKQYFALQYGDRVLAQPPARGLNWLVYLLPPLMIVVGLFFVYRYLSTSQKRKKIAPVESAQIEKQSEDKYVNQLEQELKKRDQR
ncbi:MAG TPA: cytochrome c-type biogenesis protein CcmH [Bellilinea sp.]|nr:cytochrome c-type biogenesis protein CcmH [Bellilinea sp.]